MSKEIINPYGLYRNTVPRSHISGLHSDPYDHQTQGWWLPYYSDGQLYLVDTYHIDSPKFSSDDLKTMSRTDAFIKQRIEAISEKANDKWTVIRADSNYYYGGSVRVTPAVVECFEEICDLRDFAETREPRDYKPEDTVNYVKLWFEHAYPSGVSLLRKGAEKNTDRTFESLLYEAWDRRDMTLWESDMTKLSELSTNPNLSDENKEIFKALQDYNNKCREIKKEYQKVHREYLEKLEDIGEREDCYSR